MEVQPQEEVKQAKTDNTESKVKSLRIITIIHSIGTVILAVLLISSYTKIAALEKQVISLSADVKETKRLANTVDHLRYFTALSILQHDIEEGVVTNDLVVKKVDFTNENKFVIDVYPQPQVALKYQGSGKFDMQDREVRGMVEDLLSKVKEQYTSFSSQFKTNGPDKAVKWDDAEIRVTVQNYEIGTYKGGKFVLKGETN